MTVSSSETASASMESSAILSIPLEGRGSPSFDDSNPTQAGNVSGSQANIDLGPPQASSVVPSIHAKNTLWDSDVDCPPLMEKVQEFLDRKRSVSLLSGNSGAGKSTFLKHLERELWLSYKPGGRIPLYIDLPYIHHPECYLIEKQLRKYNLLDHEIRTLLEHRQFVVICDGYDECRLKTNLYTINGLGRSGQQDVKMIISCRSTYLGRDYHGRFKPHGSDPYNDSQSDLLEEATIGPFSKADITTFVQKYLHALERESNDKQPTWTASHFMNIISTIPDMPALVTNPILLSLALKVLPSLPNDELDRIQATSVRLLGTFVNQWIKISKVRLERSTLSPEISAVFEELESEAGFEGCVEFFLIRLAEAMSQHQTCHHVVEYEHTKHKESWKAEFIAQCTKPTLLRDASPLTKMGIQHRFIHSAFFAYFRFRAAYDPDASDDSDDESEDGNLDDDGDASHSSKGRSLCDSDSLAGGDGGVSGNNNNSTGGNGESHGGNGGSGGGSSSGGSSGSEGDRGTFENGDSSRRKKDGSDGDKDDLRRNSNGSRLKRKKRSNNPRTTQNLFKDPEVLELLVESAASDPRLKKRLIKSIEQSKSSTIPSMGAANAIVILLRSGEQFHDTFLDNVSVPSDYLSEEVIESDERPESILTGAGLMDALLALNTSTTGPKSYSSSLTLVPTLKNQRPIYHPRVLSPPHHGPSNPIASPPYINNMDIAIAHLTKDDSTSDSVLVGETAFVLPGFPFQLSTLNSVVAETLQSTKLNIIDLPTEVFQHLCRFCTLHELAALRNLSIRIRDLVDDSITSRKTFAKPYICVKSKVKCSPFRQPKFEPSKHVESKEKHSYSRQVKPEPERKHNPHSCYVHIAIKCNTKRITAVFTRYDKEHNYLEFKQKDPVRVEIGHDNSTLGQLDFSNWEQQLETAKKAKNSRVNALSPSPLSSRDSSFTMPRPTRSTFTQAGPISATQIHMEQELINGGPIPPITTSQPFMSSVFGFSTTTRSATYTAGIGAGTPARFSDCNHMKQYVFNKFASTGSRTGKTTKQLRQEAFQRLSAVDNEVLPSKEQYRFDLTEGAHYTGDDDFIIRYTIKVVKPIKDYEGSALTATNTASTPPPTDTLADRDYLEFKVDYISLSWRWIVTGAPKSLRHSSLPSIVVTTKKQDKDLDKNDDDNDENDDDEEDKQPWQTLLSPLPDLRIGRMYARRLNMVLEEIGRQGVSPSVRGELRDLGYDTSLFPKNFVYANLRDEHVLEWVTEKHFGEIEAATTQKNAEEQKDGYDDREMVESTSFSNLLSKHQAERVGQERDKADKAELEEMVERLKNKQGYLTARNILEEMLACQGYSRDLIWKYTIVRREMMGPVPSQSVAKKLLTIVIECEAARGSSFRPRISQF
ncbi:hypothetical protein BGX24_011233 [Mortierella sp. AD032]|nr:hypothetical protein BGX24_011233 [Mortierella sp. AD032]